MKCGRESWTVPIVLALTLPLVFCYPQLSYSTVGSQILYPKFRSIDAQGHARSGAKLYTYEPGTSYTTPMTTYSDINCTTPNTNPIVLDTYGEAVFYTTSRVGLVLKTAAGATIWSMDNVLGQGAYGSATTIADGTATPSIVGGSSVYLTANTSSTTITSFTGGTSGQQFDLIFGDNYTTLSCGGTNLKCNNGIPFTGVANDSVHCSTAGGTVVTCLAPGTVGGGVATITGATPAIGVGSVYVTNNLTAATMTNMTGGTAGRAIDVLFGDSNTTVDFNSGYMYGNMYSWKPLVGDAMRCTHDGSKWYCTSSSNRDMRPLNLRGDVITTDQMRYRFGSLQLGAPFQAYPMYLTSADASSRFLTFQNGSITLDATVSGAGGLDTGSLAANTSYYVYAIYNPSTRDLTCLMSTSPQAPTLPSGYTYSKFISLVRTDATPHLIPYSQRGSKIRFTDSPYTGMGLLFLNDGAAGTYTSVGLPFWVCGYVARYWLNVRNSTGITRFSLDGTNAFVRAESSASAGFQPFSIPMTDESGGSPTLYYYVSAGTVDIYIVEIELVE